MNAIQARLDAWRAAGQDRLDPLRFALIASLAQRAQHYSGAARQVLETRLAELIQGYEHAAQSAPHALPGVAAEAVAAPVSDRPLSALTADIRNRPRPGPRPPADAQTGVAPPNDTYPELAALDDFRALWEHFRTDKQVRESLRQVPENAGPLNSNHLVHRSLSLMRTLSPGYLRQFMTYVDALSALERLCQAGDPTGQWVARLDGGKKGGRGKAR